METRKKKINRKYFTKKNPLNLIEIFINTYLNS